jgi:putative phosphoribosyl transferase
LFRNRREAGKALAKALEAYHVRPNLVVLALPRGGVPVAYEVAHALGAPLDVFVVRKLGVPSQPELAMGAVASGGALFLDEKLIDWEGIPRNQVNDVIRNAQREIAQYEETFRGGHSAASVAGKTVILVDDGLATGSTMRAAVAAARQEHAARVVVAVPVCPHETCELIDEVADEVVCLETPHGFTAVGEWYQDFEQTTDDEVMRLLNDVAVSPTRPGDEEC